MKKGVLITIFVLVIFMVFLALVGGFIYMQLTREPYIPQNSYLEINFSQCIVDNDTAAFSKMDAIRDFWYQIKRAKIDNRIKGIILKIPPLCAGFAKIEDIGRSIEDFKKSGKKVIAYIEDGGIREYYLATFADKIYVFKGSYLFLKGLASEAMFLKNTLSKLGIEAEMFHIGEYKTAGNTFTKDHMTPAHKEAIEKLLQDIYNYTLHQIAARRNVDAGLVKAIFEESPISNEKYLHARLIDRIVYEDEILKELGTEYNPVSFQTYKQTTKPRPYPGRKKIAVIFASGEIHSGKSGGKSLFGSEIIGSGTVSRHLKIARKNPSVKAVVLRIDSPGGSARAAEEIRRETELLAKEKPLVISMSDLAASGGYWISMSSSHVMALPQTITGSIGVVFGKFVMKGLYDKIGIDKEIVKTSKYADLFTDYRRFNQDEIAKMSGLMNDVYAFFLEIVSKNRQMKIEAVDKIARGRVWSGTSAIELNLVDKLGGLNEAIEEARKLAKIPASEKVGIKIYPREKTLMDFIFELLGTRVKASEPIHTLEAKINRYKNFFPALLVPYKVTIN
jgi:protease-4